MPEGHVVHRQARQLTTAFKGEKVRVASPQGRFTAAAKVVSGKTFTKAEARGKHLFIGFDNLRWIHIHLGLYGKWQFGKGAQPDDTGLIRLRITAATNFAQLRGPAVCELLTASEMAAVLARIGPDPIHKQADPERAFERVHRSAAPIGALLMNQRIFAGVGNIYRAEVLFRHELSPFTPGRLLTREQFDAIWSDLVFLMTLGAKDGRIDTVRAAHLPEAMGRQPRVDRHGGEVYVYRREGMKCFECGAKVQMADMQGRKLYWCAKCQVG